MLQTIFRIVLTLSVAGSLITVLLFLLRPITQRVFNQTWRYRMCILAVMFFLVPVGVAGNSLYAALLHQSAQPDRPQAAVTAVLDTIALLPVTGNVVIDTPAQTSTLTPGMDKDISLNIVLPFLPYIWLIGAVLSVCTNGFRYIRFRRRLIRTGLPVEDKKIYSLLEAGKTTQGVSGKIRLLTSDTVKTPMLTGIFRTLLVLPEVEVNERELSTIFKHELIHYQRRDLWVKTLMLLMGAIHWFNPVIYLLTKEVETSCEFSCDEQVVRDMSVEDRHFYGETILNMLGRVAEKQAGVYATLAETKKGIERRLTLMLRFKKMSKKTAVFSVVIAMLCTLSGCIGAASVSDAAGGASSEIEDILSATKTSLLTQADISDLDAAGTSTTAGADVINETASDTEWVWPVEGCDVIFWTFGTRYHPIEKIKIFNDNIQITGKGIEGAAVYAALAGTVSEVSFDDERGNYIMIDHGNGIETFYLHLDESLVSAGDPVAAGDTIGTVGSTGKATAPFLAFGVYLNGIAVDPLDYLKS